jgi:hypothetical protein
MKMKLIAAAVAATVTTTVIAQSENAMNGQPFEQLNTRIYELEVTVEQEVARIDHQLEVLAEELDRVESDSISRDTALSQYVELLVERVTVTETRLDNLDVKIADIDEALEIVDSRLENVEQDVFENRNVLQSLEASLTQLTIETNSALLSLEGDLTYLYNSHVRALNSLSAVSSILAKVDNQLSTYCPYGTSYVRTLSDGTIRCQSSDLPIRRTREATQYRWCDGAIDLGGLCSSYEYVQETTRVYCPPNYFAGNYGIMVGYRSGSYNTWSSYYSNPFYSPENGIFTQGRYATESVSWRSSNYEDSAKTNAVMYVNCYRAFGGGYAREYGIDPVYTVVYPDGTTRTYGGDN